MIDNENYKHTIRNQSFTMQLFKDFRGYTSVLFDVSVASDLDFHIVQINQGFSIKPYTLRGLHYQEEPHAQAKLVSCLYGSIYNVAVDIRPDSPTFGKYAAEILTTDNQKTMYSKRFITNRIVKL